MYQIVEERDITPARSRGDILKMSPFLLCYS
nr:MAG TPA: hypothetical protein [Caudoviricetes sp.]DAP48281.1 MAG TPA: hypothetical protein [Caudoviricetes sp.]